MTTSSVHERQFSFSDVYLALMDSAIDNAVPEYFETIGISALDIPPYAIKLWASVMVPVRATLPIAGLDRKRRTSDV